MTKQVIDIPMNVGREISYEGIRETIKEKGRPIIMRASIMSYNPAFGLVGLVIHESDRDKLFGDSDTDVMNGVHEIWRTQMKEGTKKLTVKDNDFLFKIELGHYGDEYGPNHDGLGILEATKFSNGFLSRLMFNFKELLK